MHFKQEGLERTEYIFNGAVGWIDSIIICCSVRVSLPLPSFTNKFKACYYVIIILPHTDVLTMSSV